MFEYIKGTLTQTTPLKATVEAHGVGYGILIGLSTYSKLPQLKKEVLLYTSWVVREDSQRLYGFLTLAERDLFERFTQVSGIGPKTALGLLGQMEITQLQLAISQGNIPLLCKIPGIGKKTAERLVVEMRESLKKAPLTLASLEAKGGKEGKRDIEDALNALVHLGYPPLQAQNAIQKALEELPEDVDLAKLITAALRHL